MTAQILSLDAARHRLIFTQATTLLRRSRELLLKLQALTERYRGPR